MLPKAWKTKIFDAVESVGEGLGRDKPKRERGGEGAGGGGADKNADAAVAVAGLTEAGLRKRTQVDLPKIGAKGQELVGGGERRRGGVGWGGGLWLWGDMVAMTIPLTML